MANDKAVSEPVCLALRQARQKGESISEYNSAEKALAKGD